MTITEKVAYIQGLFDGMGMDRSDKPEARVLAEMLDVLKEVGDELEMLDATLDEHGKEFDAVEDAIERVAEEVSILEDAVYTEDDDCEFEGPSEDSFDDEDEKETEIEEEDFFEVACPNCGEKLVIDDEVLEAGSIDCPKCGQKFALSFDEDEEVEE